MSVRGWIVQFEFSHYLRQNERARIKTGKERERVNERGNAPDERTDRCIQTSNQYRKKWNMEEKKGSHDSVSSCDSQKFIPIMMNQMLQNTGGRILFYIKKDRTQPWFSNILTKAKIHFNHDWFDASKKSVKRPFLGNHCFKARLAILLKLNSRYSASHLSLFFYVKTVFFLSSHKSREKWSVT